MTEKTKEELNAEARKLVNVTGIIKKDDDGEVIENKEEKEVEIKEEVVETKEETIKENKEEIEAVTKTEEELETEKAAAKTVTEKARIQRKIDKEVAKRKTLEEENAELKRKLAEATEGKEGKYDEDEVEKRAETKAQQKQAEREFVTASNRLADAAEKIDKDFLKKIKTIAEDVAPIPGHMIGILDDLDNGAAILANLADDVDEYERIITLNPTKAAVELAKIGNKLLAKPEPKKLSKLPEPINPIGGKTSSTNNELVITDKEIKDSGGTITQDFIRKRNAQIAERQKMKAAGYR
jgi:hypothetical protein